MGKIFFTFHKNYKPTSTRSERTLSMVNTHTHNYTKTDHNQMGKVIENKILKADQKKKDTLHSEEER